MIKYLQFINNIGKYTDTSPYTLTENDTLDIVIKNKFSANTELYVIINNGEQEKKEKIFKNKFTIDNKFLQIGECYITIIAKVGGQVVGKYKCIPLVVVDLDDKNIVIDELEKYRIENKNMSEKIHNLECYIDNLQRLIELYSKE